MSWKDKYTRVDSAEPEHGGRGNVVRVTRNGDVSATVFALKEFRDGKGTPDERLLRRRRAIEEVAALTELSHARIPRVHDSNMTSPAVAETSEKLWLVEDRVDGKTLDSLRGSPTDIPTALAIVDEVLDVLDHCHPTTVHRDIKPDNIIRAADGHVFVIDFGQCFRVEREEELSNLHDEGLGNKFLHLPELNHPSDSASARHPAVDITFVVGLLYFALTGRYPRQLQSATMQLPHEVEPISVSDVDVNRELRRLFDRGFEYRQAERFQSVAALRAALSRVRQPPGRVSIDDYMHTVGRLLESRGDAAKVRARSGLQTAQQAVFNRVVYEIQQNLRGPHEFLSAATGPSPGTYPPGTSQGSLAFKNLATEESLYVAFSLDPRSIYRVRVRHVVRHGEGGIFPVAETDWIETGEWSVEEILKDVMPMVREIVELCMVAVVAWLEPHVASKKTGAP